MALLIIIDKNTMLTWNVFVIEHTLHIFIQ